MAELNTNIGEVSLRAACMNLQLHNVVMSDDPCSIVFGPQF